ncbi:hypothetical protein RHMOL_Rhmol01G0315400 [Rhododendron molle]|uniref:Uncharacterized protein n=1 Tax=Rhododendron molle TaxID=49168 RepID=A0ACC0QAT5_RHOML|nr:hypothetical protein RHMOL_Rhmol01G0315400 [Rhododendron molle]
MHIHTPTHTNTLSGCLDAGDKGGYTTPPDLHSGSSHKKLFGSVFRKGERNTVAASSPAQGGFANTWVGGVVGKSGRIGTILPLQIQLPFILCHPNDLGLSLADHICMYTYNVQIHPQSHTYKHSER